MGKELAIAEKQEKDSASATGMVNAAASDIGAFIRSQRESAEVSLRQLADLAGVSNPYLSQIERGLRKPSADVLAQIAKGLRVSAEVLYVRAGILEQRGPSPVRDAVLCDANLTESQRGALLEIYESFLHVNGISLDSESVDSSAETASEPPAAQPVAKKTPAKKAAAKKPARKTAKKKTARSTATQTSTSSAAS